MCQITISSLIGIVPSAGQAPDQLEVTGTVLDCPAVVVTVTNANTGAVTAEHTIDVGSNGGWTALLSVAEGNFDSGDFICGDGQKLTVRVRCKEDLSCEAILDFDHLPCRARDQDCPAITIDQPEISATCNDDGTRTVQFKATVTPGATAPVFVQWQHDDEDGAAASVAAPTDITDTRDLTGGTHTSRVVVLFPEGCGEQEITYQVPDCDVVPVCPSVSFEAPSIGACNDDGERPVSLTAAVELGVSGPVEAELIGENGAVLDSATGASGSVTLTVDQDFPLGTYELTVNIIQPAGCPSSSVEFEVEACEEPPPPECPSVDFATDIAEGCVDGRRLVTVLATVTQPDAEPLEAVLEDENGAELDSGASVAGSLVLSDTRNLEPGTYSVAVRIIEPDECPPASTRFTVPECEPVPPPVVPESTWCFLLRILGLILFIVGLVLIWGAACSSNVYVGIIGGVITAVGFVLLVLWAIFCGRAEGCLIFQRLIELLEVIAVVLGILAVIFAILAAFGIGAPCLLGLVIDLGIVGSLLALLHMIFRIIGCRFRASWVQVMLGRG